MKAESMSGSSLTIKDDVERVLDRAKHELLARLDQERLQADEDVSPSPAPEWLTAEQLADYWQLRNREGALTTAGIRKWIARRPEDFPLPHARMGDLVRFHRVEVDQWARDEATRRGAVKGKATVTATPPDSKLRRTLTAVG